MSRVGGAADRQFDHHASPRRWEIGLLPHMLVMHPP